MQLSPQLKMLEKELELNSCNLCLKPLESEDQQGKFFLFECLFVYVYFSLIDVYFE